MFSSADSTHFCAHDADLFTKLGVELDSLEEYVTYRRCRQSARAFICSGANSLPSIMDVDRMEYLLQG